MNKKLELILSSCKHLCEQYPEFFKLREYTHPVIGLRNSLEVRGSISVDVLEIDIEQIEHILILFSLDTLTIHTKSKYGTISIIPFFVDPTVVRL